MWVINNDASHEIMSCNIHPENGFIPDDGIYQLWVTRPNGKNLKIADSNNRNEIVEIKNAIDYAIENKETALRLN